MTKLLHVIGILLLCAAGGCAFAVGMLIGNDIYRARLRDKVADRLSAPSTED